MAKRIVVVLAVAGILAAVGLLLHLRRKNGMLTLLGQGGADPPAPMTSFSDDFSTPGLNMTTWTVVEDGQIAQAVADTDPGRHQLRLAIDTDGTRGEPIKVVEVRARTPLDLTQARKLDVTLTWPQGETGYLEGGILLSPSPGPTAADKADKKDDKEESALRNPDWLRIEYVGVPPGNDARAAVYASHGGHIDWLYHDGWPLPDTQGRTVGTVHLTLVLRARSVEVDEDGRTLLPPTPDDIDLSHAYLSLFVRSRAGFPEREVRFGALHFGS